MRRSRLLLFLLVLVLVLPPGFLLTLEANVSDVNVVPGITASLGAEHGTAASSVRESRLFAGKAKHRHDSPVDRRERKERRDRKERRERKQRSRSPEQARIEAMVEGAPPRIPALAIDNDPCGPDLIQLPKSGRCTHGPDPEPPPAARLAARNLRVETPAALCDDGDGISGFRVQVLYLWASGAQDNFATSLSKIRQEAEGANTILRNSQPEVSDKLNYHFVRTAACEIEVADVEISRTALLDFDRTIEALEQQNFDETDRIYLMFADTDDANICGIGTVWPDDRKSTANFNNRGPSYARADLGCWDAHTAAHELMHNLGAVQDSAPHSTGYGHCIDEYDVMCYRDGPGVSMQVVCADDDIFEFRYDCNNDDYFARDPRQGNYLASNWNTADNWFLTQEIPDDVDLTPPHVTWVAPVGNGQTHIAGSGAIPLRADAVDASGVEYVEFWLYDANIDDWVRLGEDFAAPYTSSVNVSDLQNGLNYLTADAFDAQGNWVDEGIWIQRSGSVTAPVISLVSSTASVKAKKSVALTAAITNAPASGTSVEFRVCRGGSCTWDTGQSLGIFAGSSPSTMWKASGKGQATFLAQVTSEAGAATSNPATVSVKKAKKKR